MADKGGALVPVEQRDVEFHGDRIVAVLVPVEGQAEPAIYVPVRPLCDFLGLDWSAQRRRVGRDAVLAAAVRSVVVTTTQLGEGVAITTTPSGRGGGPQEMLCLPVELLHGWLFGVTVERVKPELRERLNLYRAECFAVLWRAFHAEARAAAGPGPDVDPLVHIRDMALAIAAQAERQLALVARVDKAALVVRDIDRRLTVVEQRVAPGNPITEEQAADLSQRVKALALAMTEAGPNAVHFQAVWGELYRRFGVASYRALPVGQYVAAVEFLDDLRAAVLKGTGGAQ